VEVPSNTPPGWLSYGCHFDLGHSGLNIFSFSAANNNRKCGQICTGYPYFGTMNGMWHYSASNNIC
jgi:hypothetical protein